MNMNYFNAEKIRDDLVVWIKNWFDENGGYKKIAVVGVSGGKDSTVVAGLCVRALGKERVIGVLMPNGEQKDIGDSYRVCEALGIKYVTINIAGAYGNIANEIEMQMNCEPSEQTLINLAPRLRMTTLYGVSQTVGGRVVNTSNKSEFYSNWYTRWGDECGDVKPLINLTKSEVVAIGKTMTELPIDLVEKAPTDGLTGKTDEDKLGYTYENMDKYLRGQEIDPDVKKKIEDRINGGEFKRSPVPEFRF